MNMYLLTDTLNNGTMVRALPLEYHKLLCDNGLINPIFDDYIVYVGF